MPGSPKLSPASGGPIAGALCTVAMLVLLYESWSLQPQLDDSFISYRYARNWVEGFGLVWNPGERVEGITNLLWTATLAGCMKLGMAAPVAGHWLGLFGGLALFASVTSLATAGVPQRVSWIAGLAPLVVLSSPALPYFGTSGMETLAFVALIVGALAAHARSQRGLATLLLCLTIIMRPDGAIVAGVVLGFILLEDGIFEPRSWKPALIFVAVGLLLTAFRIAYYGSPVPNTFYAKVGGVPLETALVAVRSYLVEAPAFLVVPALLSLRHGSYARAPLALCAGTLGYVIASGGTAMTFSRFLIPIFPTLAALAASHAARAFDRNERLAPLWLGCLVACAAAYTAGSAAAWSALAISALACLPQLPAALRTAPAGQRAIAIAVACVVCASASTVFKEPNWRNVQIVAKRNFDRELMRGATSLARKLNKTLPEGSTVAAIAIGVIGYQTRFQILDLLGLTDKVIASSTEEVAGAVTPRLGMGHLRSNSDYVLRERRPDVIMVGRASSINKPTLTAVRALWENPDLHRYYVFDNALNAYRLRKRPL